MTKNSNISYYKKTYPVMEYFYTIQGEGVYQGKAAYFIRLAGCDVGCVWCDVKESWDKNKHPDVSVHNLIDNIKEYPVEIVVITGGEPLMYDLKYLTSVLNDEGYRTHIETSGAYSLSGQWDWICLSPKKFKLPKEEIYKKANELKVIVYNKHDLLWGQELANTVNKDCVLTFQPEWSKEKKMIPLIVDYVKKNPKWKISLQTHKYMEVP